jgi:D-sedoheptulose 7-phosphate isomerase
MRTFEVIRSYLGEVELLIDTVPRQIIQDVVEVILTAYQYDRTIYVIGSAGSAATASIFATNLMRRTIHRDKPRLRVFALTDNVASILGLADEYGYAEIFMQQLWALLRPGDVLIAFSSGGYTQHLSAALEFAGAGGAITVLFTGRRSEEFMNLTDHCVSVPSDNESQIESLHLMLSYAVTSVVRDAVAETVLKPQLSGQAIDSSRAGPASN